MVKTALYFGAGMQLIISLIIVVAYLFGIDRFEYQSWFSLCFLVLLTGSIFLAFQQYSYKAQNGQFLFTHLVLLSVLLGFIIGLIGYFSHYIEATFIDPAFSQKSLQASRKYWEANNYSDEAIAGQVELTESFHNPVKWGFFSGLFILGLTCTFGIVIAAIMSFLRLQPNTATVEITERSS